MGRGRGGGAHLRGTTRELHQLQRLLPATPASARLARVTARVACRAWRVPGAADVGVLVASELVTTVLASGARGQLVLRILMTPRRLRLEVHDPSGRLQPTDRGAAWSADVLEAAAVRSGIEPYGSGAHAWAEIPLDGA